MARSALLLVLDPSLSEKFAVLGDDDSLLANDQGNQPVEFCPRRFLIASAILEKICLGALHVFPDFSPTSDTAMAIRRAVVLSDVVSTVEYGPLSTWAILGFTR